MVFGLGNIKGLSFLNDFDLSEIASGAGLLLGAVIIFLFMAAVIGLVLWKMSKKKQYSKKIHWFEEIHGDLVPVDDDVAKELTIPGTSVQVFYIKKKDLYLPRGTHRMGKDAYWYCVRNNREIVNFTITNLNEEMKLANLDFDHTDMRYAQENLKELIKRNYRDNSKPWWREYKDVIATVILIFFLSLSFFFLMSKIGDLIGQLSPLINQVEELVKTAAAASRSSGVVTA